MATTAPATDEQMVSLHKASEYFPIEKPPYASLVRWATIGVRGVTLDTYRVGNKRFTSRQRVERFLAALNAAEAAR